MLFLTPSQQCQNTEGITMSLSDLFSNVEFIQTVNGHTHTHLTALFPVLPG